MAEKIDYSSIRDILMPVSAAEYGQNYQSDMLSMYRGFVASAETVSDRRNKANTFYLSACTGLLGANSWVAFQVGGLNYVLLSRLVGVVFAGVWMGLIASFRSLNSAKFKVIQEIEQHLPLAPYKAEEWVYKKPASYMVALSKYESYMPLLFIVLYVGLGVYSMINPPQPIS